MQRARYILYLTYSLFTLRLHMDFQIFITNKLHTNHKLSVCKHCYYKILYILQNCKFVKPNEYVQISTLYLL